MALTKKSETKAAEVEGVNKAASVQQAHTQPRVLPIKNAFNLEVIHREIDHPEFKQFEDRAKYADPTLKNLLEHATVKHIEPKIGTELSGIQLHELTDAQKDELALLTAERGVVFLVDQKITAEQQLELGHYWGPLHFHQTLGHAEGFPDVTYERQPPSCTTLRIHTASDVGGDTIWASGYEAYNRLTPPFQTLVEGLVAVHSAKIQAEDAIANGQTLRRPFVEFEHPVVRVHTVTRRKALFVNPLFTRRIKNLSIAESDAVLQILFDHIIQGHEFQVRYHLTKDTVALWDNRITSHAATWDFLPGNRLGTRVTVQGEIPFYEEDKDEPAP